MRVLLADDSDFIVECLKEVLSIPQQVEIVGTNSALKVRFKRTSGTN